MPYDDWWSKYRFGKGPSLGRYTPRAKGKRRLDIGWGDRGEGYAQPGSTLGLDTGPEDITERMEAGELLPGFQQLVGTGTDLPYRTGSLDVVTSDHALGLNYDTWEGLEEAIRVLRPGGKLYVRTPLGTIEHKENAREIREWLRTQPVTNVKVSKEKTDYYETYGEEDDMPNYIIRFTKL